MLWVKKIFASIFRPAFGIAFLVAAGSLDTVTILGARPYQWVLVFCLVSLAASFVLDRKEVEQKEKKWSWFVVLLPLLFLGSITGLVNADVFSFSLKQTAVLAVCLLIALLVYWEASKGKEEGWRIINVLAFSSVPVNLFAVYQNVAHEFGWPSFEAMTARPNGFFYEPDWLGMYAVFLMATVFFYLLAGKASRRALAGYYLILLLNAVVLVITVARASWLAMLASILAAAGFMLILFLLRLADKKDIFRLAFHFGGLIIVLLISILAVNALHLTRFNLKDRVESIYKEEHIITVAENDSTREKIKIDLEEIEFYKSQGWRVYEEKVSDENVDARYAAFTSNREIGLEHPILGQGQGSVLAKKNYIDNANNIFYEWWISAGLIGIFSFVLLLLTPLYGVFRAFLSGKKVTREQAGRYVMILMGVISIVVTNIFNSGVFFVPMWILLGIIYGSASSHEDRT